MSLCPKCGSEATYSAREEAPAWAKAWTKCMACGKRWDLAGPVPSASEEDDDDPPERTTKRSGADLVALVMRVAQSQPAPSTKETTMAKCSKQKCSNEAADDSVRCVKHRDAQRASNEKFQRRAGKPTRTYTRRTPLGVGGTALSVGATMPSMRTHAPISLAEPTIVNGHPPRRVDLDGNVLTVLDGLIAQRETELAMLRGTKEILERHG